MKPKALVVILIFALAGCTVTPEKRMAWETRPLMDIRHGMANAAADYQLGRYKETQGDFAAAEASYEKALVADPKSVDALNALGAMYARQGKLDRAASAYRQVGELSPQRAYLYNNIGYALHLQGRHAEAVEALRQAVTLDPGYERAWVNLQNVALKSGRLDMAALAARRSLGSPAEKPVVTVNTGGAVVAAAGTATNKEMETQSTRGLGDESRPPLVVAKALPMPARQDMVIASVNRQPMIRVAEVPARSVSSDGFIRVVDRSGNALVADSAKQPEAPAMAVKVSMRPSAPSEQLSVLGAARIEVSNGNGIGGYAIRVRSQLKDNGAYISRTTNFTSYDVRRTYIEYRSGFVGAAQALRDQVGGYADLKEAIFDRPGTDLRLVLGANWLMRTNGPSNAKPADPSPAI